MELDDRSPAGADRGCEDADDVRAVRFERETQALISLKGGGHNIAGSAVMDGGLMIVLSPMNGVTVFPATSFVRGGPGATLTEIDAATVAHGLVVPTGINSTTGIAGLTLGGGFGCRHGCSTWTAENGRMAVMAVLISIGALQPHKTRFRPRDLAS